MIGNLFITTKYASYLNDDFVTCFYMLMIYVVESCYNLSSHYFILCQTLFPGYEYMPNLNFINNCKSDTIYIRLWLDRIFYLPFVFDSFIGFDTPVKEPRE